MSINKLIVLVAGSLVTLLLIMMGLYLSTPLLLNWQVNKLIHDQGCDGFTGDFERPEWNQLRATTIQLSNCSSGIKHLFLNDVRIGYQPEVLIKQQRLGNIHIENVELNYQLQSAETNKKSAFVTPLPSQLFASLPLSQLTIENAKILITAPIAQADIQGRFTLTPEQLGAQATFNVTPTSSAVWQSTALSTHFKINSDDEFDLQLKDKEAQFYSINGKLLLKDNKLGITAADNIEFTPALAWLNQTLQHPATENWQIDGDASNAWKIQLPIEFLLGDDVTAEHRPIIQQSTQVNLQKISNVHESLQQLSGTLNFSSQWQGEALHWQLKDDSDVTVQLSDGVMPDDNLSSGWRLYSSKLDNNNLAGQFQWRQPWRFLSSSGKLQVESTDTQKLDINAVLSNLLVSENSHSSQFNAIARSKSVQSNGVTVTNLQGNFTGLAATHGNEISLKLQTGSYFQGDHLGFNTLSLQTPKAVIIKPIDLRAAFQQKLWQLSPMEISVATGHAAVFNIKAKALNGQFSLKSNNYDGESNTLSKAINGEIIAKAYKLSTEATQLGSLQLRAPFTLNYPSLEASVKVAWPLQQDPIDLSSQLTYRLDQRRGEGSFLLPKTSLSNIAALPLLAPLIKKHNIHITEGDLSASGQLALKANGKKTHWTIDLIAQADKADLNWNTWRTNDMNTSIQAQVTQNGIGQTKVHAKAPKIDGVTELTDLDLLATYDPVSQNIHFDTASVKVLGGKLSTQPFNANLAEASANFEVEVEHVELAELLKLQTDQDIHATGVVFGRIPVSIKAGKSSVSFGFIAASDEGGTLAYTPPNAAQLSSNPGMKIALTAINNFIYNHLSAKIQYQPDGTLWLDTALKGYNPDWQNGQPIDFNIRIEQNLLKLLQALQFSDKLSKGLDDKIRQRIKP